ncbi:putative immunity protein [Gudongella sp. DL1XJH-153]|uniref:putative immunity protein n=1 Tax=Gudongella sp. DL1XJH-153 TaxID=3409804 RepID=UPI003BB50CB3
MFRDVEVKIKKKNKILFSRESKSLEQLVNLMDKQSHRTLVLWALDCGQNTLRDFESAHPEEKRPRKCLESCEEWAKGKIKMQEAKRAILDAHAVAKEIDDEYCKALCHGIGHAGATVHVGSHAIGLPMYELTAIVLSHNMKGYETSVNKKIESYIERLMYWQENADKINIEWADFIKID